MISRKHRSIGQMRQISACHKMVNANRHFDVQCGLDTSEEVIKLIDVELLLRLTDINH